MSSMDIFSGSAFQTRALTGMVEKLDYLPGALGSMGIFEPMPVRNRRLFIDRREGKLTLVATSATGAPPEELEKDTRDAVPLETTRLAKSFTLYATELQDIRGFGSETEPMAIQVEYGRRMKRVRQDIEYTHELHRFGAVQGKLLDADGTTVIYDYFAEFDEAEEAAVAFGLGTNSTNVRKKCHDLTRSIARSSKGAMGPGASVHALTGDDFYDKLINHPNVEKAYLNYAAAADLASNKAFGSFVYGGITWHNYRGSDDESEIAVPKSEARFFPVGAPDVFKKAMAPHESLEFVNTLGRDVYAMNVVDRDRNLWTKGEVYSYPLYFCQQPRTLRKATTN